MAQEDVYLSIASRSAHSVLQHVRMTARDGSRVSHFTRPRDERKRMALRLGAAAHIRPRCTAYGTIALRGRTVVRYAMDKKCRACGKGLPEGSTVRKVFCDSECRMNWHAEQRANGTPGKRNTKRSQSAKKVHATQRTTDAEAPTGTRPVESQTSQPPAQRPRNQPHIAPPKIGANADCPCGSKKKYKKCCGRGTQPRA